ncbi:5'-methylthioadenosine/adenosylhomocysteine nucleosidase [Amnibacterium flavum]|uniref:adenosylhomocysteine nucleosidase n=1 Tax=Amnibacterium flavum TaxID=2173173 RepID=A0A2V1HLS5_9MICO|nr:5'-methylthioadenosine/adenosylhomocysteine nucleosidase [Amnibacterium flavum]PVZ93405.1 hypothetical protein DDQ50_15645 [Amnibacterium flavum]
MTVVVIAAMREEASAVAALADSIESEVETPTGVVWTGFIDGEALLVVQSGVGLVNAASAATAVLESLDLTEPVTVISAGSAGGVGDTVSVGDVVVAAATLHGDADARAFGYALGQVPGMPARYDAPDGLVRAASNAIAGAGYPTHSGVVVSTDSFVAPVRARSIRDNFAGTLAVDMESAAIAQVAYRYQVPFISVRAISDLADQETGDVFDANIDDAAARSAHVVVSIIRGLYLEDESSGA